MKVTDPPRTSPDLAPRAKIRQRRSFPLIWLVPLIAAGIAADMIVKHARQLGPVITIQFDQGMGLDANHTLIRYRGIRVGEVRSVELAKDAQHVLVEARIDQSAASLAREGSMFWVVRPEAGAGWMRGLETIVAGSYVEVRPGNGKPAKKFVGLDKTPTADNPNGGLEIVLTAASLGSVSVGSPVYYRELEVGSVQKVALGSDATTVTMHVHIEPQFSPLVRTDSKFWNAGGLNINLGLLGVKTKITSLTSLFMGGIAFATPPTTAAPATNGTEFALSDKVEEKWLKWSPAIVLPAGETGPANPNQDHSRSPPELGSEAKPGQ
jgi:paraquat-inducible protein B